MNRQYWENRIVEYKEMIRHIEEQSLKADDIDRVKLSVEVGRLENEVRVLEEHLGIKKPVF